ncbi:hypothetical protein EJB05_52173 [Eragrostis curvula]|uniref:Small ribosomal subunit protein uS15c n=1 Tax=Eragrostis curvula TaxID=38414 RepID=A0A5J9STN9_9POAL|nr:hypothetical protein EJB05_52173 [Eragrostis curvula]
MALLRARPNHNPLLPRPFSSSSSPFPALPSAPAPSSADPAPPYRFADIRDRLSSAARTPSTASASSPRASPSFDDLRRSLSRFRNPHSATPSSLTATPSFLDILANNKDKPSSPFAPFPPSSSSPFPFRSLRDSLRKPGPEVPGSKPLDWKSLLSRPQRPAAALGRSPKETAGSASLAFLQHYTYEEMGRRLAALRPSRAGKDDKDWFSLEELSARLGRLREMDEEEKKKEKEKGPMSRLDTGVLREALEVLQAKDQKKTDHVAVQNMSIFMGLSGQAIPEILLGKPQEELVEKYFHPDHMSSAEKMKLELQRVRDEFKMSENDCGSARVQVAQLTTKIKHLSATLHKKDKHSRKGLQEMVQRRKKYLKYLRRTDWDSYCFVLSKLGLRDVPEFKPPDYKSKSSTKTKSKRKSKRKMKA